MKASDIVSHFQEVGTWVDWNCTWDKVVHGDPEAEVKGIATAWTATNKAIWEAADKGCNLFISHEPIFYWLMEPYIIADQLTRKKMVLLNQLGMTVIRCHDTWDRMPEVGIPDAWASWLGFPTEPRPVDSFYKTCLLDNITVEQAARIIMEKVRPLGQDVVLVYGDRTRKVRRMVVGTGAITQLPVMYLLKPDVILATDDGTNTFTGALWVADLDIPMLVVNHATAEKPGMKAMATYLQDIFPQVPVSYVDVAFPYSSVA